MAVKASLAARSGAEAPTTTAFCTPRSRTTRGRRPPDSGSLEKAPVWSRPQIASDPIRVARVAAFAHRGRLGGGGVPDPAVTMLHSAG